MAYWHRHLARMRRNGLALGVLLLGLCLSGVAGLWQSRVILADAEAEFLRNVERTVSEIERRFTQPVYGLRGLRASMASIQTGRTQLSRAEFSAHVASRDLANEFPGVRGFGFIEHVARDSLTRFVAAERADGAPGFAIRQLVDKNHPDLFVIKLIEPAAQNVGAQGLDVGSEAQRRVGAELAASSGLPTISGVITLVQDQHKTPGVLAFLPVYRPGAPLDSAEQRRAALLGLLYSPIVIRELLGHIPDVKSGRIDFELYDSRAGQPLGNPMFDADDHVSHLAPGQADSFGRRFSHQRSMGVLNRELTLRMNSTAQFDANIDASTPWLLFGAGALISAMLALLLLAQAAGRQQAEALVAARTAELVAAQRDNQALLSTLNLAAIVSVADPAGRITMANDAFCNISGYSRDELLGQTHRIVNSGQQSPQLWGEVWRLLSAGHSWRGEICNRAKDGSFYWVDTFIAPVLGADGRIEKYIAIRTDITSKKHAEEALRSNQTLLEQARQSAEAASTAKSQFLANMSHEIRTPMNAILGLLTLLRKTEMTPRQADYAAKSDGAARQLLGLLNEILDFSKIEAGKMELDPQPFDMEQLLRDLAVILAAGVGGKPVEVLFDIDPKIPQHLVGDAMRLRQILTNICGNAIKFTECGEVLLGIQLQQRRAAVMTLKFSVQDSGIGIAPENQARIFSGFTQAESSTTRRFGGTGLGVAISQRFVALMGGELALDSALGRGSRFEFTIDLPQAEAPDSPDTPAVVAEPARAWRVLVVDDNAVARDVLTRMGRSLGWQVDPADSGELALRLLQDQAAAGCPYEVVLLDWQMPGLDGWQTIPRIHQLGLKGAAPLLLMVSANGRDLLAQRSQAEQDGLDGYLLKPLTAAMLSDAVAAARLGRQHERRSQAPATAQLQRLASLRLLLVEDNLNNQQVARELLEDEGARVQIANHGQEALELLAAAPQAFDVVLMDLQMPVMDGLSAARLVRQQLGLTQLPIIAMTANAMNSDREACLAAGMNDHVGKPFNLDELVRVLRQQAGLADAATEMQPAAAEQPPAQDPVEAAAQAAGVEIELALRRLGGKRASYTRLLGSFVRDLALLPEQLRGQLAQADFESAARQQHTLKGTAATLGATELAANAGAAEKLIGEWHSQAPAAADLARVCETVCAQMEAARPGLLGLHQALLAAP